MNLMQFKVGLGCQVRRGGRARESSYSPHIWAGYQGCRSVRTFKDCLRGLSESKSRDRVVTGQPARMYKAGLKDPIVNAVSHPQLEVR